MSRYGGALVPSSPVRVVGGGGNGLLGGWL